MCEILSVVRGFVLEPGMLGRDGSRLQIARELEEIQKGFEFGFEILFGKNGGFVICLLAENLGEEIFDATEYLKDFLDVRPRLIDLSRH